MNSPLHGVARLETLGVIAAAGDDAVSFLQGQLTQDVALLAVGQARLAAYCSPKGRMLASFVMLKRSETEVLLVISRDILAATLKRLSMFVLRAKCKLRMRPANSSFMALPAPPSCLRSRGPGPRCRTAEPRSYGCWTRTV